ncbi:MAG: hypothetical protein KME26_02400 [Oscillatoria princeps RMCB-10]|nr:hypothetical protein [Oscillatoria princeps RMCB-10]
MPVSGLERPETTAVLAMSADGKIAGSESRCCLARRQIKRTWKNRWQKRTGSDSAPAPSKAVARP